MHVRRLNDPIVSVMRVQYERVIIFDQCVFLCMCVCVDMNSFAK